MGLGARTVLYEDVHPHPWCCEGCHEPFAVGDLATPTTVSHEFGDDPYGLDLTRSDYDLSTGCHLSRWLCVGCLEAPENNLEKPIDGLSTNG